eukprot:3724548-Rhodomonas_salina.2
MQHNPSRHETLLHQTARARRIGATTQGNPGGTEHFAFGRQTAVEPPALRLAEHRFQPARTAGFDPRPRVLDLDQHHVLGPVGHARRDRDAA